MITNFKYKGTEKLFNDVNVERLKAISRSTRIKLELLDATVSFKSLRLTLGNRLESLNGDREGQYSIKINNKRRICFIWQDHNAHDIEIVDSNIKEGISWQRS